MSLESQIAALVDSTTALTQEVANKQAHVDARVTAKIADLDNWRAGHLDEHPAIAVNFNASLTALGGTEPQQLPLAMGVHAGGDFWGKFDVTIIPVRTGEDPTTRPPVVRELLQYMGCDRQHFSAKFNIVQLTIKSIAAGFGPYVFHIPYQHVKVSEFTSVVMYHKVVGGADWGWTDSAKKGVWNQVTHHFSSNNAGEYVHVDIGVGGAPAVGDTLYLALPQIVPGKWNPQHRAPQMYNIFDLILDVAASGTPPAGMLGGVFAGITNTNR
ncbi:hypothetical protein EV683_1143 [Crenobacter luteus]|uniref:hypothetical protein n=1 Tax=Crenobacter luteus TaxID=1452487 RepID=UPI00104842E0|nr:hypothetical protein [Crenobacter luteus]TCP11188.1 hypothetical protein EV683_1143 [Crenobacter luteus]